MHPGICPNCGADVPPKAKACPECGADDKTGWSDTAYADRLGLPDDNFDYNQFVKAEFEPDSVKPRSIHWFWWVTALVLVGLLLLIFLR